MKIKLTLLAENDKPTFNLNQEQLKHVYQGMFSMLLVLAESEDKITVLDAEIIEENT